MSSKLRREYSLGVEGQLVGVELQSSIDIYVAIFAPSSLGGLGHVFA